MCLRHAYVGLKYQETHGKLSKNILGRLRIVSKLSKMSQDSLLQVLYKNMVADFGCSQKRGGGLRPPRLLGVHILSKYCKAVVLGQCFVKFCRFVVFFLKFELPEDIWLTMFRGSSEIVDLGYVDNVLFTVFRGPSGINQNLHSDDVFHKLLMNGGLLQSVLGRLTAR